MPVTQILLLRHGHRMGWSLDPTTGKYSSTHPFPTALPADPPLAAHGVRQSHETAAHLAQLLLPSAQTDTLRIYSSLFYRCLETLGPTVRSLNQLLLEQSTTNSGSGGEVKVRGERGISEWFGLAWFDQPTPLDPVSLRDRFFPWLDAGYKSLVIPNLKGERIGEIHDRVREALRLVVEDVEREYRDMGREGEEVTVLMCGHAAQIICAGRALTGKVPEDLDVEDFKCFTCGISRFVRKERKESGNGDGDGDGDGKGGGWDCVLNSWCGHLSQGEERGWHFHGDESFDSYGPPRGIVVEKGTEEDDDDEESQGRRAEGENGSDGGGGTSKL